MTEYLQQAGIWLGFAGVWALCLVGIVASAISFSGTWFVVGAAALASLISRTGDPGWWAVLVFALISALAEGVEALAGAWGVKRRGGSSMAGLAALVGGLIGMFLGAFIPILFLGSLIGMLVGSFTLAYAVERNRLKHSGQAASIAWGAVIARLLVILFKLGATLGMTLYLVLKTLFS